MIYQNSCNRDVHSNVLMLDEAEVVQCVVNSGTMMW